MEQAMEGRAGRKEQATHVNPKANRTNVARIANDSDYLGPKRPCVKYSVHTLVHQFGVWKRCRELTMGKRQVGMGFGSWWGGNICLRQPTF